MGWTLDYTTPSNRRILYSMDCSLGHNEFLGAINSKFPNTSPSGTKSHIENMGLTNEKFNE